MFDNSNVNNDKQIKQKTTNFCSAIFRIIKFFFHMLWKEATLEFKVAPTNRNSSALLLHTSKTRVTEYPPKFYTVFRQAFLLRKS